MKKLIKLYVIDELKLAIEYNGNYFHLNKVLETNIKGYRLIHTWENN